MLTPDEQAEMKGFIDQVPDRNCFIHGDYNPGNVLVAGDGTLTMIDLGNSAVGHPVFDLAGIHLGIATAGLLRGEEGARGAATLWQICKSIYFSGKSEAAAAEYEREISVFSSMRFLIAAVFVPQLKPGIPDAVQNALTGIRSGIRVTF